MKYKRRYYIIAGNKRQTVYRTLQKFFFRTFLLAFAYYEGREEVAMKIHFVTEGTLDEYWNAPAAACDLLFFGFNGLGTVDYAQELGGVTSKLEDAAVLSRELGCTVVSGCATVSCGIKRKSAAVAERGRILGVSDMLSSIDGGSAAGGALKVYETGAGKLGILVAEDVYFPEIAQMLSLCDADILLAVFGGIEDFVPQLMMRACAFVSGVPVAMCAAGTALFSERTGEMALVSPKKECDYLFSPAREYHLVSARRRGFFRKERGDF